MRLWNTFETRFVIAVPFNPLNAQLNPICHMLALLEVHHILHVSRIRVNILVKGFNDKRRARGFVLELEAGMSYCIKIQIDFADLTFTLFKRGGNFPISFSCIRISILSGVALDT